ncbi:MAG TPA: hypothetical protein VMH85_12520 [Terriglobales bacterium]|nr:hypothetical protein [Terriglobales bacterium]
MKNWVVCLCVVLLSAAALAMPLGGTTRTVIPSDIQQIISVDYRALKNSDAAMAMKKQLLPPALKTFEEALKGVGIDADKDVDQLTFASYRVNKQVRIVGIAAGDFSAAKVLKRIKLNKIKPVKYREASIYPMTGGMQMVFLDDGSLLFGDVAAVKGALDARDGYTSTVDANSQFVDMIGSVDSGTVWSVLDQEGTQNMLRSALGDASKLADYDTMKKRLLGSRYTMNFSDGVKFDLDVVTSDSITAATLSSLVKAGMLYRKVTASPVEKTALDNVTVNSDSSDLQFHFKTDEKQFQSLLHSDLFAAVSR